MDVDVELQLLLIANGSAVWVDAGTASPERKVDQLLRQENCERVSLRERSL
jgi:hypothetical protein